MTSQIENQVESELPGPIEVVPVVRTLPAPFPSLSEAFQRLGLDGQPCFALDPVREAETGRYAYLFFDPYETFRIREGIFSREAAGEVRELTGNPLAVLQQSLRRFRLRGGTQVARFGSGAVGYLGYDCVQYLERIALPQARSGEDEASFTVFRKALIYDREAGSLSLVGNVFGEGERLLPQVALVEKDLEDIARRLLTPGSGTAPVKAERGLAHFTLDEAEFSTAVRRIKDHIGAGDIFQCVLSRRESFRFKGRPFDVFRSLCEVNPSPYLYYYHYAGQTLLGASPELLVRVRDGRVETCPIAGTRPRGKNAEEDRRRERSLRASSKEKAEHLMLVDLGRNDLGRVCRPGTVKVKDFMQVQRFSHVMHLVSTVQGELGAGQTSLDALFACFPAGTLTGAPKIRAMQIISALEPQRRGAYGGSVVMYDFAGDLESCITIRSLVILPDQAHLQAGAGVVADSRADRELEEIRHKAQAVCAALEKVGRGEEAK
jgi:anthranilate synthase component 1